MGTDEILERIQQADMVLVGLGEEFDDMKRLRDDEVYQKGRELLLKTGHEWMLPAWNEYCSGKLGEDPVPPALKKLAEILGDKNFYVVSVATNSAVERALDRKERLVMPCGGTQVKQCEKGCEGELSPLTEEDKDVLKTVLEELYNGQALQNRTPELGRCSHCGCSMILNNVFTECYNENGYLSQWQLYTKWLQGTLNRRLFLLELGVGMQFPSVIRWPFEKVVTYNEKAFLCRVHEKLYQLPQELAGKGCGISKNAIDWLVKL